MSLEDWVNNGWLRQHETSRQEIADLLAIVDRDLADAGGNISPDWRFGIAYNGALKLCTILLHASGYRPEKTLQHYRAITAMPMILGGGAGGRCRLPGPLPPQAQYRRVRPDRRDDGEGRAGVDRVYKGATGRRAPVAGAVSPKSRPGRARLM